MVRVPNREDVSLLTNQHYTCLDSSDARRRVGAQASLAAHHALQSLPLQCTLARPLVASFRRRIVAEVSQEPVHAVLVTVKEVRSVVVHCGEHRRRLSDGVRSGRLGSCHGLHGCNRPARGGGLRSVAETLVDRARLASDAVTVSRTTPVALLVQLPLTLS